MARLIDADALIGPLKLQMESYDRIGAHERAIAYSDCIREISEAPTVQKAVKPKEVNMYPLGQYACGSCGHISVGSKNYHAKYCPECGRVVKWDD